MVNPEDIHASNIIQTKKVAFMDLGKYVYISYMYVTYLHVTTI